MNSYDKDIISHLETVGPYTLDELVLPIGNGKFGACRNASPNVAARVVREMPGRFTYDQAFDFCDYHSCDGYVDIDVVLEALLEKTDCTQEQRDELLIAFGSEKMTDPIYAREAEELRRHQEAAARAASTAKPSFFDLIFGAAVGHAAYNAFLDKDDAGRGSVYEDVPFQDFNNAWGSNNDHNWEADGDTQWDDHGEGLPGGSS